MINFFRKKRKALANENRSLKYARYAIGEIVLVVIGILIALQIGAWNNRRIDRKKEIKYLKNIKHDLLKDIESTTYNIDFRKKKIQGTNKILAQIEGQAIDDLTRLGFNIANTLYVERFEPNNITFKEMVSSGNVNLITNDSIKKLLLELELLYKKNTFGIEHETFEYQEYISNQVFKEIDVALLKQLFLKTKTAEELQITEAFFEEILQNKAYKNGCTVSNWTSEEMIGILEAIENKSKKTIIFIEKEIKQ